MTTSMVGCGHQETSDRERDLIDSLLTISADLKDAEPDSSRYYAYQALAIAERSNDAAGAGEAYNRLGYYYRTADSLDAAKDAYRSALKWLMQTDSNALIAKANSGLGVAFKEAGVFDSAVLYLQRAVDYAQASGDQVVVANYLNNLANAFDRFNSYADARRYHMEALAIRRSIDDTSGMLMSYNNLASVYYNWQRYDSALLYNRLSLTSFPSALSGSAYANSHNNAALTLAALQQYDSARIYYEKALGVYETSGDESSLASVLSNIGISYMMQERYPEALAFLSRSDSLALALGLRTLHAKNIRNIAMSEHGIGAYTRAAVLYDSAILFQDTILEDYRSQLRNFADIQTGLQEEKLRYTFELESQRAQNMRNIAIAAALVSIILLAFYYNRRQLKKQLEFERALESDRRRISADLHDEVGSALGSLSYFTQMVQRPSDMVTEADKHVMLERIRDIATESVEHLGDIVWMVNPANDTCGNLVGRMNNFASELFAAQMINYQMEMDPALDEIQLSMSVRKCLYLVFKEAVYNISKYASAQHVHAAVTLNDARLICMTIQDDGMGFDTAEVANKPKGMSGNGLKNMRARIEEINGSIQIQSGHGRGTVIKVEVSPSG